MGPCLDKHVFPLAGTLEGVVAGSQDDGPGLADAGKLTSSVVASFHTLICAVRVFQSLSLLAETWHFASFNFFILPSF